MKNLISIILVLFIISCGENKKEVNKLKVKEMGTTSFTTWKKSVEGIQKLSDFEKEKLQSVLDKINKQDFEKVINKSPIEDIKGRFFALVYSEGEVVTTTINYFEFSEIQFKRTCLKMEYDKSTFFDITIDQVLNYSDFKLNSKNGLSYSGFLILTNITNDNELVSTMSDIPETIDKYLN